MSSVINFQAKQSVLALNGKLNSALNKSDEQSLKLLFNDLEQPVLLSGEGDAIGAANTLDEGGDQNVIACANALP